MTSKLDSNMVDFEIHQIKVLLGKNKRIADEHNVFGCSRLLLTFLGKDELVILNRLFRDYSIT